MLRKQQRGGSLGGGDTGGGSGSLPNGQSPFDDHDWDGAQELSDEEKRELSRELDEAIRQGALVAGKMGSGGDRELEELLKPQVDWREVLRDFVCDTCVGTDYVPIANLIAILVGSIVMPRATETVGNL